MKSRKYAGGGEIEAKIQKLQTLIDNPNTPETDRKNFVEAQKKFKEKLASEKSSEPVAKKTTPKPVAKKTTPKPVSKKPITVKPVANKPTTSTTKTVSKRPTTTAKAPVKKTPKGVQMLSKKRVVIDGKEMNTDSKEFCDYLTDEFIKRKEQAKSKKTTRKKTKSVMAQVSTKIEQAVEKAIKTGISKQKPTLKKNPQVFIGKVEKLETATKNFLQQLKEVLGSDYDAKEVTDTANAINKLIEDLKKKYTKK
jgi:uncharacterized protein (UPF0335 family)